jgi:hypothetical protein
MQNDVLGQDTLTRLCPVSTPFGRLHEVPLYVNRFPLTLTATQYVDVGQDTEVNDCPLGSAVCWLQPVAAPRYVKATPMLSTATQKEELAHETLVSVPDPEPTNAGVPHVPWVSGMAYPAASTVRQNLAEEHEMAARGPLGSVFDTGQVPPDWRDRTVPALSVA